MAPAEKKLKVSPLLKPKTFTPKQVKPNVKRKVTSTPTTPTSTAKKRKTGPGSTPSSPAVLVQTVHPLWKRKSRRNKLAQKALAQQQAAALAAANGDAPPDPRTVKATTSKSTRKNKNALTALPTLDDFQAEAEKTKKSLFEQLAKQEITLNADIIRLETELNEPNDRNILRHNKRIERQVRECKEALARVRKRQDVQLFTRTTKAFYLSANAMNVAAHDDPLLNSDAPLPTAPVALSPQELPIEPCLLASDRVDERGVYANFPYSALNLRIPSCPSHHHVEPSSTTQTAQALAAATGATNPAFQSMTAAELKAQAIQRQNEAIRHLQTRMQAKVAPEMAATPEYVYMDFCTICHAKYQLVGSESRLICPNCWVSLEWVDNTSNSLPFGNEDQLCELSSSWYERVKHFRIWLCQFKVNAPVIPEEVYDALRADFWRIRVRDTVIWKVTPIRDALSRLGFKQYCESAVRICYKLKGLPAVQFDDSEIAMLVTFYRAVQNPFFTMDQMDRNNFLTSSFVVHMLLILLGWTNCLESFPLLKNKRPLRKQMRVWWRICSILGWSKLMQKRMEEAHSKGVLDNRLAVKEFMTPPDFFANLAAAS